MPIQGVIVFEMRGKLKGSGLARVQLTMADGRGWGEGEMVAWWFLKRTPRPNLLRESEWRDVVNDELNDKCYPRGLHSTMSFPFRFFLPLRKLLSTDPGRSIGAGIWIKRNENARRILAQQKSWKTIRGMCTGIGGNRANKITCSKPHRKPHLNRTPVPPLTKAFSNL